MAPPNELTPPSRASALPLVTLSLLIGVIYLAVIVLTADHKWSNLWELVRESPPFALVVFVVHCVLARRPQKTPTTIVAIPSAVIWTIAAAAGETEMMGVSVMELLPSNFSAMVVLAYLVVASTFIMRGFLGPDKVRMTLRGIFGLTAVAGVLLALVANSTLAEGFFLGMVFFWIPHVSLYGMAVWSIFRSAYPPMASILTISLSALFGYAFELYASSRIDWYLTLRPILYTTTLLAFLALLKLADHYAVRQGADKT